MVQSFALWGSNMMSASLMLVVAMQDPLPDPGLLRRVEAACRALLQPMKFGCVKTTLCSAVGEGVGSRARLLFTESGSLAFADVSGAMTAVVVDTKDVSSLLAPVVMSAPPWHYEERADSSGRSTVMTLLSDGRVDVTKIRNGSVSQCSVTWVQATERLSVSSLVSPLPSSSRFLADWFGTWQWRVASESSVGEFALVAKKDGVGSTYDLVVGADGMPKVAAMTSTDRSSGFLSYFEYTTEVDRPVWIASILSVNWSPGFLAVYSYAISDHELLDPKQLQEMAVDVRVGDLVCDGRSRPYKVVQVAPGMAAVSVPRVRVLVDGGGVKSDPGLRDGK